MHPISEAHKGICDERKGKVVCGIKEEGKKANAASVVTPTTPSPPTPRISWERERGGSFRLERHALQRRAAAFMAAARADKILGPHLIVVSRASNPRLAPRLAAAWELGTRFCSHHRARCCAKKDAALVSVSLSATTVLESSTRTCVCVRARETSVCVF